MYYSASLNDSIFRSAVCCERLSLRGRPFFIYAVAFRFFIVRLFPMRPFSRYSAARTIPLFSHHQLLIINYLCSAIARLALTVLP